MRVNSVSSGLAEEDLQVIMEAKVLPPAFMLPKVEDTQEVKFVSQNLFTIFEPLIYYSKLFKISYCFLIFKIILKHINHHDTKISYMSS